ncbi:MAG TPA: arginase [Chroococcales cyanobacterium]
MAHQTKPSAKESKPAIQTLKRAARAPGSGRATKPVTLIYVPLHLGGSHRGVSMGPAAIKVAEIAERVEKLGVRVAGEVDVPVPNSMCWWDKHEGPKCVPEILEVSLEVAARVESALEQGTIPITIGGDHSLAIGSIAGVANYFKKNNEKFGLVWFDAHGDINTPATSQSGNVHGMPLAVALGRGDKRFTDLFGYTPKIPGERTALIGIRDLDEPERELIDDTGITAFTMREVDHMGLGAVTDMAIQSVGADVSGIHVSFDIDVIDPDVAPGVSTPARGGLDFRESMLALTLLAETGLITSVDIAELNPAFDVKSTTADLACELILSTLGKRIL